MPCLNNKDIKELRERLEELAKKETWTRVSLVARGITEFRVKIEDVDVTVFPNTIDYHWYAVYHPSEIIMTENTSVYSDSHGAYGFFTITSKTKDDAIKLLTNECLKNIEKHNKILNILNNKLIALKKVILSNIE